MLIASVALIAAIVAVSYANGANDTFKGVATLYGSGVASYRVALIWAVATTLAGSLLAAVLAQDLVTAFSGKGLVPAAALAEGGFMAAVALGAAFTVFAAALLGIPISTTHSLIGALTGAGLMASGTALNFAALGQSFMLPLALSPFLSVALVVVGYRALMWTSARVPAHGGRINFLRDIPAANGAALRAVHFLSAGAVSFARGTNDAPKIAGVALAAHAIDPQASTLMIALAMAVGGVLHSRRIARTMSTRILPLSEVDGALANTVTSGLVVSASLAGFPVSTTHVSVGSLFGLATTKGGADWSVIRMIVSSWFLTLPVALAASALIYAVLR